MHVHVTYMSFWFCFVLLFLVCCGVFVHLLIVVVVSVRTRGIYIMGGSKIFLGDIHSFPTQRLSIPIQIANGNKTKTKTRKHKHQTLFQTPPIKERKEKKVV
jgi:hypothetical protein